MAKVVLFIHGAWLTPAIWERFSGRYAACGYTCMAPAWPGMDQAIASLRHDPSALALLDIGRIVDHYERLIRAQPEPPVLVGHAFGGLIVQILLDRGLGAAGIAIAPVAPRGVFPGLFQFISSLRRTLPQLLRWQGWRRTQSLSPEQFSKDCAQNLTPEQQRAEYQRHIIPAPGKIFYQAAFGMGNQVNFNNDERAPLLLIAAENDRMVTPATVASNYWLQRRSLADTDFLQFPGRSHWLIAEPGWEQVADASIEWLQKHSARF